MRLIWWILSRRDQTATTRFGQPGSFVLTWSASKSPFSPRRFHRASRRPQSGLPWLEIARPRCANYYSEPSSFTLTRRDPPLGVVEPDKPSSTSHERPSLLYGFALSRPRLGNGLSTVNRTCWTYLSPSRQGSSFTISKKKDQVLPKKQNGGMTQKGTKTWLNRPRFVCGGLDPPAVEPVCLCRE